MIGGFTDIERLNQAFFVASSLKVYLQSTLPAAKVPDSGSLVLRLLQFVNEYIEGILWPLIYLLAIALMVISEQRWLVTEQAQSIT